MYAKFAYAKWISKSHHPIIMLRGTKIGVRATLCRLLWLRADLTCLGTFPIRVCINFSWSRFPKSTSTWWSPFWVFLKEHAYLVTAAEQGRESSDIVKKLLSSDWSNRHRLWKRSIFGGPGSIVTAPNSCLKLVQFSENDKIMGSWIHSYRS